MKHRLLLLVFLFVPAAVSAQPYSLIRQQAEVPLGQKVLVSKLLLPANRLLLVSETNIRVLDLTTGTVVESRPIETPHFCEDGGRAISPGGRRMIILGNYNCDGKENKIKRPVSIWDLETGKQITTLDNTAKPIMRAYWSSNGKTLITASNQYYSLDTSIEVSFWDGETFAFRNSLPDEKINWWYLTRDGAKCFYSLAPTKNFLYLVKYLGDEGGPLKVWDIANGRLEETIAAAEAGVPRKIRAIDVSPDERFVTFVAQPPKSKETARRQVILEIDKQNHADYSLRPKYEIPPTPHIWEWGVNFSPDGKYFALLAKKNLQIYETRTGEKKYELTGVKQAPAHWLNDNQILLFDYSDAMEAIEVASGKRLYKQDLVNGINDVYDSTAIVPHWYRNLLLTYSNQYVKLFDSVTGELLQTLVAPPMDYSRKKPRLSDQWLVSWADWSADGRGVYVMNHEKTAITLWRFGN